MKNFKKNLSIFLLLIILFSTNTFAQSNNTAKNVIVMIPDGMSVEALSFARWMTENNKFTIDDLATGLVRTNNSNTPIADSAPAGTAMATGIKTISPYIGSYPLTSTMPGSDNFNKNKINFPVANVLEGANRLNKSTGIISTSNIQHATPADFSAHHLDRNAYEEIAEQQVYQNIDIVLGAGSKYLEKSIRKDKEDLIKEIKSRGYDYITNTQELKNSKSDKIWGSFNEESMSYDLDRDEKVEPSLAEMTEKALDVLSKNNNGLFLMVEGSEIDWAAHANDPIALKSDILAFDKAVKVAKDFADKNPNTILLIASDHGTGGITFGNNNISKGYDKVPLDEFTKIIKDAKITSTKLTKQINKDKSNISNLLEEHYNIKDLSTLEIEEIKNSKSMENTINKIISNRSNIAWTTEGHVGGDVALYCYSTNENIKPLSGTVHNSDIGKYLAQIQNIDLDKLSEELYIPARKSFEDKGAKVEFISSPNQILKVTKDNTYIEFFVNKNYCIINGEKKTLSGLIVFNGEKVFIPKDALSLIN